MEPIDELRLEIKNLRGRLDYLESRLNSLAKEPVKSQFIEPVKIVPDIPIELETKETVQSVRDSKPANNDIEAIIGGSWLNKIGAITLIIGIAFYLKYAIDNDWINETGRIVIGLIAGILCIGLGERFQKKSLPVFAQGLSGAGIAILYFTVFAAYSFYSLIPQLPAFAFLFIITATAIVLSVWYNARSIASLGILTGFLTPILLSGGPANTGDNSAQVGVLIYIAILDIGILAITRFKNWRGLNIVSLIGTIIIFTDISMQWDYRSAYPIIFSTLFFLIFAGQAYVQNVLAKRSLTAWDVIMAVASPILFFIYIYHLYVGTEYKLIMGIFSLIMAAAYAGLSHKVFLTGFKDAKICVMYLSVAAAFLIIAVPLQLDGYWVAWGWGVEAAILSALGFYLNSYRMRFVALGILWFAVMVFVINMSMALYDYHSTANSALRTTTYILLTCIGIFLMNYYNKMAETLVEAERVVIPVLLIISTVLFLLIGLSSDLYIMTRSVSMGLNASVILTLLWLVYGLITIIAGIHYKHRPIRIFALILLGVTLTKTYLSDVWWLPTAWRIVAFIALGVMLIAASYFYQKYKPQIAQIVSKDNDV